MKIMLCTKTGANILSTVHGGVSQEWSMSIHDRHNFTRKEVLFDNINNYLASLDKGIQGKIFSCYMDIAQGFDEIDNPEQLQKHIIQYVTDLYSLVDIDNLRQWCRLKGNFNYPPNLFDTYDPKQNHTQALTYLRSDYTGLLFLSTALRLMVPIWGEYIKRNKMVIGTVYKEHMGVMLMGESELYMCPEIDRLTQYIKATLGKVTISATAIHGGLGTEEQADWLLSLTLVSRLAIAESIDPNASMISNMYNYIVKNIDTIDKKFGRVNKVHDKHPPNANNTMEDNSSIAENYRLSQNVTDAPSVIYSAFIKGEISKRADIIAMAKRIDPAIPVKLINTCINRLTSEQTLEILPFRIHIAGVVLQRHMSMQALGTVDYNALLIIIGMVQAYLYHSGFKELAHFITATGKIPNVNVIHSDISEGYSRARLTKEKVERLMELYPFHRQVGKVDTPTRATNVGIIFIECLNKDTLQHDWYYNSPGELLAENEANNQSFVIPAQFRNILAQLLLHCLCPKDNGLRV